ncbi:MAG: nitrate/nitrite transporter [Dehalococcoidia bacterium]
MASAPASTGSSGFPLSPELRRAAIVTVALLILGQSFQALIQGGLALFLPRIRPDLGLSFAEAGALSFVSTLVYAFMQIPAGYLVDRFGPWRLFFIGLLGTNVLALSFALLESYPLLLVNQGAAGFFRAMLFAPGLVLIASWFPPERRATAMGVFIAGGFSSSFLLNIFGPPLEAAVGWRMAFVIFASLGIVSAFVYYRFASERPRPAGRPASIGEAMSLFRYRVMWVIGGIQFVRFFVALAVTFWLPTYLVAERGYSLQAAGVLVAAAAICTMLSNFVGGYVSDRLQNPLAVIGGSLGVLAVTSAAIVAVPSAWMLVLAVCVNASFIQFYFGPLFAVPVEMLGARRAGISSGFSNFFANIGGFVSTWGMGEIKDATGSFTLGFLTIAAVCVAGILMTGYLAIIKRHWTPPAE